MPNLSKLFFSNLIVSVLSCVIFALFLTSTEYTGGQVGMAPFIIILSCLISLAIMPFVTLIIGQSKKVLTRTRNTLFFCVVSTLILFFVFGANPFRSTSWDLDLWYYLSIYLAGGTMIAIQKGSKKKV